MFDADVASRRMNDSIKGLAFSGIGRFGLTMILEFGNRVPLATRFVESEPTAGKYALHVQCPARICQGGRIVLGSGDLEPGKAEMRYDTGASVVDRFAERLQPKVQAVTVGICGDLRIAIEHDIFIEILPVSSRDEEQWRFLHRNREHYIFPDGEG
ncbi:hypothetical protein [Actinomadura rayongensis]|uniref:Uncharacterized protein n=1 Tax=Actinomadura rayongensis TaxID=1429076 RepID=A0A6I4W7Q3_9ACTN|nr:hypothetical protein [Actinomadura rayongensis]MXQ64770.1 hypothetical protein [Actinomadura rayongensis]